LGRYLFTIKSNSDWFPLSEIILTIGRSNTVEAYLKSAAHYHKFTVIVAESGPSSVLLSTRSAIYLPPLFLL
jgi:translation initiation factor eIF-2B subunit beta